MAGFFFLNGMEDYRKKEQTFKFAHNVCEANTCVSKLNPKISRPVAS